ncbi:MAG TPA: stage II sporulation protein D [Bacillota bacterium]|nr:stage II sporulation protein D [Bacillota bacterium]
MKRIGIGLAIVITIVLLIPAIVIYFIHEKPQVATPQGNLPLPSKIENQISITVYRAESKKVETVPIEEYIMGVIAAEMPAEFELEALKAQAMAARTYIVRRIVEKDFSEVPEKAYVTDTIRHQVYLDDGQRHTAWGKDYEWKIEKVKQAVFQTQGQVLTYEAKPIDATFFSVSNGFTENSEDYWGQKIPYLRSVEVPWDKNSPKYEVKKEIPLVELEKKLGQKITATTFSAGSWSKVVEETSSKHVAKIKIGEKVYTGREIREKLGLASTAFEWQLQGDQVIVTTFGSGHGVGMSQWGANGLAQQGKKAEEIVKYFYKGISLEDYHSLVKSGEGQ